MNGPGPHCGLLMDEPSVAARVGAAARENASTPCSPEKRKRRKQPLEVDRLAESNEDFKLVRVCDLLLNPVGVCVLSESRGSFRVSADVVLRF